MRILWSSDHHTLSQSTPTQHVLNNMSTFYYQDHDLNKVALVIKGGDLMDRLVESNNPDLFKVKAWGRKFLTACHKSDTAVLLLEGTWSHDWGQPKHLETVAPEGMDFRYVDTLSIQHYPKLNNLTVMCVPDNMGSMTPDEIWERALSVLTEHKLDKVDIIAFHGTWTHQLPGHSLDKKHDQTRWASICNYLILSGHIHIPSIEGMVHSSGSFDRNGHGEEHPKGAFVVDLNQEKKTFKAEFWENKKALPYVTLKINESTTPEALVKELHEFIRKKKLPHHAHVRVLNGAGHVVNPILAIFEKEYPHLRFKSKNIKAEGESVEEEMFTESTYTGVSINKDNIVDSLWPLAESKFTELGITKDEALSVLEEFS